MVAGSAASFTLSRVHGYFVESRRICSAPAALEICEKVPELSFVARSCMRWHLAFVLVFLVSQVSFYVSFVFHISVCTCSVRSGSLSARLRLPRHSSSGDFLISSFVTGYCNAVRRLCSALRYECPGKTYVAGTYAQLVSFPGARQDGLPVLAGSFTRLFYPKVHLVGSPASVTAFEADLRFCQHS